MRPRDGGSLFPHSFIQLVQHRLLIILSFSHWIAEICYSKSSWSCTYGSVSGLPILSHWIISLYLYQNTLYSVTATLQTFWNQCISPTSFFSFWISFLFLGLWGHSVDQSRPTHCDPMDCSPLDSSVNGIFQARILKRAAISYSRGWFFVLPNKL